MNVRKGAVGTACAVAMAASLTTFGAAAFATEGYVPTTLGNDAYTNQVDARNDVTVEGASYVGSISSQNTETLNLAESQSVTMGNKADGATPVLLTNETGKTIKEIAIKPSDKDSVGGNELSGSIADNASACWWITVDYDETDYTSPEGLTWTMHVTCSLVATFDDGTQATFHNINMNGVRTVTLKYSSDYDVYYVERTTITNHTPDPTLYYETNLKNYGNDAEFDFHVNSGARLNERAITDSRGGAWDDAHSHAAITPYWDTQAVFLPLFGEPNDEYTDGVYEQLYWNAEQLKWRTFGFEKQ